VLIFGQSSVRHNLSSSRAFKKAERGPDEKGKGALWSVDPQFEHTFEEQEARKQAEARGLGKKGKGVPLDPPLKRSIKGDSKGPLPPPLTSTPLVMKTSFSHTVNTDQSTATAAGARAEVLPTPAPSPPVHTPPTFQPSTHSAPIASTSVPLVNTQASASLASQLPSSMPSIPPSVRLPIVIGPVPSSSPEASNPDPKPIVLHQNTLILNPTIFAHLTPQQLRDLEALGAQKALEILQGYIVRFYKEKLRAEGGRGRGRGRGRRPRGGGSQGPSRPVAPEGLFVTTPLPERSAKAEQQVNTADAPPMGSLQPPPDESPGSPVIVVDDDEDDAHVSKRPRLDSEGL
jgi:forkhead box protein K